MSKFQLSVNKFAESDIEESKYYNEKQQNGLGNEFLSEL